MTQLKTIHLHGALKQFSEEPIPLDVHDVKDIVSAFKSRFNGFNQFLHEHPEMAIVLTDKDSKNPRVIEAEFVNAPFVNCEEIHMFTPAEGAGTELVASFASWLASYGVNATIAYVVAFVVVNVAIALAVSAVTSMLAPQTTDDGTSERPASRPSFLYNGPENVVNQGYQVPIVYGTAMTGSVVVSSGIRVEQLPPEVTPPPSPPPTPDFPSWGWDGSGGAGSGGGDST